MTRITAVTQKKVRDIGYVSFLDSQDRRSQQRKKGVEKETCGQDRQTVCAGIIIQRSAVLERKRRGYEIPLRGQWRFFAVNYLKMPLLAY